MKRKIGQKERLLLLEEKFIMPHRFGQQSKSLYIDADMLCRILMSEKSHWRSHALLLAQHNDNAEKKIRRLLSKKISISVSQIVGGKYAQHRT